MQTCLNCDSIDLHAKGYCKKCYMHFICNPRYYQNNKEKEKARTKKASPMIHPRRITFLGKRPLLEANPRIGECQICHKKVGEEYIDYYGKLKILKLTVMHHLQYHEDDPSKDTIELCVGCHNKQHIEKYKK